MDPQKIKAIIGKKKGAAPLPQSHEELIALFHEILAKDKVMGPPGPEGKQGPVGPQGPRGHSHVGPKGPQGPRGPKGPKGDSIKGQKGDKGDPGKDGSPDTAEEIAEKLNSREGLIAIKSVRGLPKLLTRIQKGGRGPSAAPAKGGMGMWIHQRTSISSATTTIPLTYNVAAASMAHIARYQGQVLDYGTHYTILGKTITLLFTPDDNTVFSIAYVRT